MVIAMGSYIHLLVSFHTKSLSVYHIFVNFSSGGSGSSKNRRVKVVLAHVLQSMSSYKRGWKKLLLSAGHSAHTEVRQCSSLRLP